MTNLRFLPLFALACIACWFRPEAALAENRVALVIGNSSYETVTVLPNPANDAKAMTDLLTSAGFEVVNAPNLTQTELRQAISNFAGIVSAKGRDTVALVFYAGHGLQVDGENFLVPIDARIQREADVPLQAMRLADVMNAFAAVRSKSLIVILDACRNNPFSEINKSGGRGLAIVDAPTGSLVSYSTAPGTEAQDGEGANSPFTAGLLKIAREPGLPIEQALKRVRLHVHQATNTQQTPWESSSLIGDFYFFPGAAIAMQERPTLAADTKVATAAGGAAGTAAAGGKAGGTRVASRTVDSWRKEFRTRQPGDAYALVIEEGTPEAFEAYLSVYSVAPYAPRVRGLLERRREMMAWYTAVTINTVASYDLFLARYGNSDLAETARRLLERARSRSLASLDPVTPTCACTVPSAPAPQKKTEKPKKEPKKEKQARRSEPEPKKKKSTRGKDFVSDEEMSRGGGPRPAGGGGSAGGGGGGIPISIGIGFGGGRGIPMGGGRSHSVPSGGGYRPSSGHHR
jgi:uncharacterized caspase-like protein